MYGFNILCEISKVHFEIWHKILNPYTANMHFTGCWTLRQLTVSEKYYTLSLSETGPQEAHMPRFKSCTLREKRTKIYSI